MAPIASTSAPAKKGKKPQSQPRAPVPLPASFDKSQAEKAVKALIAHHTKVAAKKEEEELLPKEEHVWVVVNTKQGTTRRSVMPVRMQVSRLKFWTRADDRYSQLPHPPLAPPPATSVCLIVKDTQREYKDLLATHNIKFVARVVGVEKLKGKFKPYEPRRELMRDHEVFLCDDRVVPLMPKLLGKMFFEAKKQPIPVNLARKDLKAELGRAISSTYFHPSTGTSTSTRLSTPSITTPAQTLANLLESLPQIVAHIEGGWDGVLSVGVKTSGSVMVPVWTSALGGRFEKKEKAKKGEKEGAMEVEEKEATPEPVVKAAAPAAKKEEKKKVAKSAAPAEEKPKKKSSTVGSGSAGKRAKEVVVGKKAKKVKSKA
ncbi:ribosome biogenesis protein UTP30 [Cryptococcus wingfieldii CBS 7118]|uniref:Ribosome biogenesis protein UTP30 n=1 Tax=Cryptococcus wingfieldii CBS 7118 TaxID=1295528 RepID=A0A1E3HBF2_9TREE|nr:ribosome biogenesis protein UTP30 [Cryptococcus wingfieldii CBS 7118]ODN73106.1 ribosome biogenesis protein UTP30 [Cryptococcus wingfieldii CBS 7118]